MRRKNFIIGAVVVAIIFIGLGWFTWPTAKAPEKAAAESPIAAKIDSAKLVALPVQVELPTAPAVPANAGTAAAAAAPFDPQADLKYSIPDIARLLRSGDQVAFLQTYFSPDKLNPQVIERLQEKRQQEQVHFAQHPEDQHLQQQEFEAAAKTYEALEDQTPAFNDTGDEATYNNIPPSSMGETMAPTTIVFVKINDKWYIQSGPTGPGW